MYIYIYISKHRNISYKTYKKERKRKIEKGGEEEVEVVEEQGEQKHIFYNIPFPFYTSLHCLRLELVLVHQPPALRFRVGIGIII